MEYKVDIHFWDIRNEHTVSEMFKFDNMMDALKFATDVTDHFYGIERVDISISWIIKAK